MEGSHQCSIFVCYNKNAVLVGAMPDPVTCCQCHPPLYLQTLLRAKDAEVAAAKEAAAGAANSSSSTNALQAEVAQLKQLLETAAEVAQQQLRQKEAGHQQAQQALEAEIAQAKSSAGYYQQLAQETATSLDEVKQSLAAAEEALKEAREEIKSAAAAQRARQRGQLSVLKEDETAAVAAGAGVAMTTAEAAALQQQKQQLTQQVEQLQLKLAQVQVCRRGLQIERFAWHAGQHECSITGTATDGLILAALWSASCLRSRGHAQSGVGMQSAPLGVWGHPSYPAHSSWSCGELLASLLPPLLPAAHAAVCA